MAALSEDVMTARRTLVKVMRVKKCNAETPAKEFMELFLSSGLDLKHMDLVIDILGSPLPTQMHWSMFLRTIQTLATDAQKERWLPLCMSGEMIGCYAQTELGWGSDVSSIETTATYEEGGTKSPGVWTLHTPTLRSLKAWPGGLGSTATHALVVAKHGGHGGHLRMFVVNLASAGVRRGSMGPLMGFQNADNGWLHLDHVIVDAAEALPPHSKRKTYSTMVHTRGRIIRASFFSLAKAITIAHSFACVREQPRGRLIITHEHVWRTLQKWIEFAELLGGFCPEPLTERTKSDSSEVTDLALKAYVTDEVAVGIEACRRICGGFGYAEFSGFPRILTNHLASVTYEGSNEMLYARSMERSGRSLEETKTYLRQLLRGDSVRDSRISGGGSDLAPRVAAFDISNYECNSALIASSSRELYTQLWESLGVLANM